MIKMFKYYINCVRWLYKNRTWTNTRQKFKRMAKEVDYDK